MRPKEYSTVMHIPTKSILPPFLMNYSPSFQLTSPILSNSGNALANSDGNYTLKSTKIPNPFRSLHRIPPKYLGIFAESLTAMNSPNYGK